MGWLVFLLYGLTSQLDQDWQETHTGFWSGLLCMKCLAGLKRLRETI